MLIGSGACDMKGRRRARSPTPPAPWPLAGTRGTLRVVFTADEEAGGHFGSEWLAEQAATCRPTCA